MGERSGCLGIISELYSNWKANRAVREFDKLIGEGETIQDSTETKEGRTNVSPGADYDGTPTDTMRDTPNLD